MSEVHNEQWLSLVREERVVALILCICFFLMNRIRVGPDEPNSSIFTIWYFSPLSLHCTALSPIPHHSVSGICAFVKQLSLRGIPLPTFHTPHS